MPLPTFLSSILCVALLSVALLTGCGDPAMTSYRIAKERETDAPVATADTASLGKVDPASTMPAPDATMSGTTVATAAGPGLQWTAPAHWQVKPASAMRKGSYAIAGEGGAVGDLSITAFPGDVGGETANVNRWRGQLQLASLTESEIAASVVRLESHTLAIAVADCINPDGAAPQRILGAMVPFQGATWFFKLTGPAALVAGEKSAFLDFLKTVQPAAPAS